MCCSSSCCIGSAVTATCSSGDKRFQLSLISLMTVVRLRASPRSPVHACGKFRSYPSHGISYFLFVPTQAFGRRSTDSPCAWIVTCVPGESGHCSNDLRCVSQSDSSSLRPAPGLTPVLLVLRCSNRVVDFPVSAPVLNGHLR